MTPRIPELKLAGLAKEEVTPQVSLEDYNKMQFVVAVMVLAMSVKNVKVLFRRNNTPIERLGFLYSDSIY